MKVFDRTNLFEPNKHIFRKIESSSEVKIAKEEFSDNPGHRIWELYNEVKKNLISNIINLVKLGIWVAWQVVERLNIGNIGKISNLDADIKLKLSIAVKKHAKVHIELVLPNLSTFTGFL